MTNDTTRVSRRTVLKRAAAVGAAALGSRGLLGFPAVIAAEPVTLR